MTQEKPKKKAGRPAERLAIEGEWTAAVRKALAKGKPPHSDKQPKRKPIRENPRQAKTLTKKKRPSK